jgi:hypothetical protein
MPDQSLAMGFLPLEPSGAVMVPHPDAEKGGMASRDTKARRRDVVQALLARHGRTYSQEIGINLGGNTPSALFRWLCASILFSTRISADTAVKAAKALAKQGWNRPETLRDAGWEARVRVLNRSGYARYDESTSRMLGDTADLLVQRYRGDLRRLREEAGRDPATIRRLLQEFKGIGAVGADIFCRETQLAWPELYPFADRKALDAAGHLGLGDGVDDLAELVKREELPRLVAALVRTSLHKDHEAVLQRAAEAA